jgi:hypothetical protein
MKTLLLEITDYTAQTWWSRAFMLFITDILKTFNVYFSVLDHHTLILSEYSNLSFQIKKNVYLFGYTENFDILLITHFRGNCLSMCEI